MRRSRDAYKKSDGERPRYATLASAFNLRDSKKEKVMVPVSARVTELRLNANTVDCVLEKSENYPSNWREGLDDIPDPVLAQFKKLVPRKQLPSADYVILCTGLRADFRCYCVDPKGVDASNSIQQQAAIAQTLKLVGATGTAAQAFVDNSAVTKEMVPEFKERKQEVCVRIFFHFFYFFSLAFFFFLTLSFPFIFIELILHPSSFIFRLLHAGTARCQFPSSI